MLYEVITPLPPSKAPWRSIPSMNRRRQQKIKSLKKGAPEMQEVSAGDIFFILLVGGFIWGLMTLLNYIRNKRR